MRKRRTDRAVIIYICLAALLILGIRYFDAVLSGLGKLWNVSMPLLLGLGIAYVLNLIMVRVERLFFSKTRNRLLLSAKRGISIMVSLVLILAILTLVGVLVLPELGKALVLIGQSLPVYLNDAAEWLEENRADDMAQLLKNINWDDLTDKVISVARSGLGSVLNSTISMVGSVIGSVVNFFIGLIFGIYILADKERLRSQTKRILTAYLKKETVDRLVRVYRTANETFSSFIIGQCTEAVILGTLCMVGMLVFRFPYAPMTGAFIGVTALIPIVGAYLGAAVGVFMILTVDPLKAVLFLVFILVLQQLEGNLIYPKVVGSSIGLPGMWVLAAVTVGGGLLGIGGMLLGVPAAATVYKLVGNDVRNRNGKKEEPVQAPVPASSRRQKERPKRGDEK